MKPIILLVRENNDKTVTIDKKELEGMVERAYNSGFDDGKNSNRIFDCGVQTTPYLLNKPILNRDIAAISSKDVELGSNSSSCVTAHN